MDCSATFDRPLVWKADRVEFAPFIPITPRLNAKGIIPKTWNPWHVDRRLKQAFQVLEALPPDPTSKPRSFGSSWGPYHYTIEDIHSQAEPFSPYPMYVKDIRLSAYRAKKNKVRFSPSSQDIILMEQAIAWPMDHIPDDPIGSWLILARAAGLRKTTRVQTLKVEETGFDPQDRETPDSSIYAELFDKLEHNHLLTSLTNRYPVPYAQVRAKSPSFFGQIVAWEKAAKTRLVQSLIEKQVKVE